MDISPITKYGVTLRPLTHDKIEMVRQWRNHPKIQQYMEYREEITPEMQEQWYKKISSNGKDYYFLIEIDGKDIGCINIRDIDYEKKEGEPGIFIWDDDYLESDASYRSVFAMMDYVFDTLNLQKMVIHILNDNTRAIRFNTSYGYKLSEGQEGIYNQRYTLEKEDYFKRRNLIIKLFV